MREDLSTPQQAVQSCHACIEATSAFKLQELEDHPSVIICGIKNENKLKETRKYLIENQIRHVHFCESDLNDQLTSLATEPIFGEKRSLFKRFQLLRSKIVTETPQERWC